MYQVLSAELRSTMWHEFGDDPDKGEYNLGSFEGKQHTKKCTGQMAGLTHYVLLSFFIGKSCVNLWCDGRVLEEDDEEMIARKKNRT